jgi:hypothetical protein
MSFGEPIIFYRIVIANLSKVLRKMRWMKGRKRNLEEEWY